MGSLMSKSDTNYVSHQPEDESEVLWDGYDYNTYKEGKFYGLYGHYEDEQFIVGKGFYQKDELGNYKWVMMEEWIKEDRIRRYEFYRSLKHQKEESHRRLIDLLHSYYMDNAFG